MFHFFLIQHSNDYMEEMYRLLAIAKYEDRFVIPASHREDVAHLYDEQGSCGLAFTDGPGACGTL